MIYYKSARYIDGKTRIVITDENGNIVDRNPTKERIKSAIPDKKRESKAELENRICIVCGSKDTNIYKGKYRWIRDRDDKGNWTGKYICFNCYGKNRQKNDLNSQQNIIKSIRNPRTGNIKKDSEQGMVFITQAVVAKVNNIEDLNIKMDAYNYHIDMYNDIYGRINVEYSSFRYPYYEGWMFNARRVNIIKNENYDTYILLCLSGDKRSIQRVCIIPNVGEIKELWTIGININGSKYDIFQVSPNLYSNEYQSITDYLKDKIYFSIEDIKKWMKL